MRKLTWLQKNFFQKITLLAASLLLMGLAWCFWALHDLPDPASLPERAHSPSIRIEDRNGQLLYEILSDQETRHSPVALDQIPMALQQAVIATEDRTFYENQGVDAGGILRSLWINLQGGETLAGGSTITQQVVRNLLFEPEERYQRSLKRKFREAVLAWQLTRSYTKDEILTLYLNQTDFGNFSIGVEAAAQTYFGKPVSRLDLAECAFLAGLPQSPTLYDPFTHPEAALARQQIVLGLMVKAGLLSPQERELAAAEPIQLTAYSFPMQAPHFVLMVKAQLTDLLPEETFQQSGSWVVHTTLDLNWQQLAEAAVKTQMQRVAQDAKAPLGHNLNNAAVVVLVPRSGEIMAMVGSPDYKDAAHSGALNMAIAPRQPGSSLKPLIYARALDPTQEAPWTAASMLLDVRTNFTTHDQKAYTPSNYDGLEHGPVLLREALASSLNIPAVLALDHVGLQSFADFAAQLGMQPWHDLDGLDLSLALGGGEVTLLDLTSAYGVFANGGLRLAPYAVSSITDGQGSIFYQHELESSVRVMDERVAWLISDILSDDPARYLGFGRNSILQLDRPAAVKTGTTTNFHDNWTVGYTPSLVVGVWAGNTNHEGMRDITGLTGAAPIWAQTMRSILTGTNEEEFNRPVDMVQLPVCKLSGLIPGDACTQQKMEWFIPGTEPTAVDTFHQVVLLDSRDGLLADDSTPAEERYPAVALNLPVAVQRWAQEQGLLLLADVVRDPLAERPAEANGQGLMITSPANGSIYHLAKGVPPESQQIQIQIAGAAGMKQVNYYLDDSQLATVNAAPYTFWWPLARGSHVLKAVVLLDGGDFLSSEPVSFTVKE